jgi:hypothetical protein
MRRGIAIVRWDGSLTLAKIVEREGDYCIVAVLPRKAGIPMIGIPIKNKDVKEKLQPVYLNSDQLNDELRTILEG